MVEGRVEEVSGEGTGGAMGSRTERERGGVEIHRDGATTIAKSQPRSSKTRGGTESRRVSFLRRRVCSGETLGRWGKFGDSRGYALREEEGWRRLERGGGKVRRSWRIEGRTARTRRVSLRGRHEETVGEEEAVREGNLPIGNDAQEDPREDERGGGSTGFTIRSCVPRN